MKQGAISVDSLSLDKSEIWKAMSPSGQMPDEQILQMIAQMTAELKTVAQPRYCYTFTPTVNFRCDKIITKALEGAERYVLLVVTLGRGVDILIERLKREHIVEMFITDAIASEMVEAVCREVIKHIVSDLQPHENISNSYSPGYCGWSLREQRKLFSYFDSDPVGVTLNDSCLMSPIKSVSAVLAVGEKVVKSPYGCEICTNENCYKRKYERKKMD